MQTKTMLDIEQEHFENAVLHDLKAAVTVIKANNLLDEFYRERMKGGDLRDYEMPKGVRHESKS